MSRSGSDRRGLSGGSNEAPALESQSVTRRGLSPRQLAAAELLLAGRSAVQAARELNVAPRTVFRWKRDPRFDAHVRRRADTLLPRLRAESARAAQRRKARDEEAFRRLMLETEGWDASRNETSRSVRGLCLRRAE